MYVSVTNNMANQLWHLVCKEANYEIRNQVYHNTQKKNMQKNMQMLFPLWKRI
jgi:hypothetical protein